MVSAGKLSPTGKGVPEREPFDTSAGYSCSSTPRGKKRKVSDADHSKEVEKAPNKKQKPSPRSPAQAAAIGKVRPGEGAPR